MCVGEVSWHATNFLSLNRFSANPAKKELQQKKRKKKKKDLKTRINTRYSKNSTLLKKTGKPECKQNKTEATGFWFWFWFGMLPHS